MSTIRDWRTINQWAQSLIDPQIKTDAALQATAQQLAATAATPDEKVRAVYAYVQMSQDFVSDLGLGSTGPDFEQMLKNLASFNSGIQQANQQGRQHLRGMTL